MGVTAFKFGSGTSSNIFSLSSDPAPGKREEREGDSERSMTPKCMSIDGKTLSVNTGQPEVEGIGKGRGEIDPNRIWMA